MKDVVDWVVARPLAHTVTGYAPEKIQYGIDRYQNETRRLYRVLDTQLSKSTSGYLVGDRYTIADVSCWGWVASACESSLPTYLPCGSEEKNPLLTRRDTVQTGRASRRTSSRT